MKRTSTALLALLVASSLVGCLKKKESAKAKDVDAIVSGDEANRRNNEFCGAKEGTTPEEALDAVFARLPRLFTAEFPSLRQHIKLEEASEVKRTCKAIFETQASALFADEADRTRALQRLDNLGACWSLKLSDNMDAVPVPTIHIARDVGSVHRNLIAMVTYGIMELYVDQVGGKFAKLDADERSKLLDKLAAAGTKASDTQLLDLISKLEDLRKRLSTAVLEDLKASEKSATIQQANLYFAETVDSYYCSESTRDQFVARGLTKTWEIAQEIARLLDSK